MQPVIQRHKGFCLQRVKPLLSVRADPHDTSRVQDSQVPRYARLRDTNLRHKRADRLFAAAQDLHDLGADRIGQNLKQDHMLIHVYIHDYVFNKVKLDPECGAEMIQINVFPAGPVKLTVKSPGKGFIMAHVVVLGAGLGGSIMAYELRDKLRPEDTITVITKDPKYHFVPSNPWVAVGWRTRQDVSVDLAPIMAKKGIAFKAIAAETLIPQENRVVLVDGTSVPYDYLVNATGPELAFDEVPGLGPHGGFTQSVCHIDHAEAAKAVFDALLAKPGPVVIGAAPGASCFGPAYEFLFILETALRRAKIRDRVPMTYVTPEPYIGHLGLDGVGDTKGLLESEMRAKHIKWMTSTRIKRAEEGKIWVEEVAEDGTAKPEKALPFALSMILPAFRGIPALRGIEGLSNPRGFTIVDAHQRNPTYRNVFAVGVCVAIPPMGPTPVPCGVPKTGFMIESMVTATALNIAALVRGKEPDQVGTWNAVCLADFGDSGVAFVAQPQIPPRNVNWASQGKWVHVAKIGFEKYFLRKLRLGTSEPFYETLALKALGIDKLKATTKG